MTPVGQERANFKVDSCAKRPSISHQSMNSFSRREFLRRTISASAAAAAAPAVLAQNSSAPKLNIKLGLDNFSVRALGWKAPALIDYAVSLKTDSLFITGLDAFESFDEPYLKGLKDKAAEAGLQIHVGTW